MKSLRETIRQLILEEAQVDHIDEHPYFEALRNYVDYASADYWQGIIKIHHSDGCSTEAFIAINDEDDKGGIWIDKLEVVNKETRKIDPECFRKGYAKQMLQALTRAADESQTHLTLIAAHEPYLSRQYPDVDFPDKDELAALYGDYGFFEEYSNYAQVKMNRAPKS